MNRLDIARVCPVEGCGKSIKQIQTHLNNQHRDISLEEFAASAGQPPFSFLRCAACHFASVALHGIRTHQCDRSFQNIAQIAEQLQVVAGAEPEQDDDEASEVAGAEPEQVDNEGSVASDETYFAGDHEEDYRDLRHEQQGDEVEVDDGEQGFMKQPAMESLSKLGLGQFESIFVKLLEMALPDEGEDAGPINQRALQAVYNLPGCLKNVEYRAGGKSSERKKVLGNVLKRLLRSSTLLEDVEELSNTMNARLSSIKNRRHQVGLEKTWDKIKQKTSDMVRSGNMTAAMSLVLDWEDGLRGQLVQRSPAMVAELLEPMLPRADLEMDEVRSFGARCDELREEDPDAEVPKSIQLSEEQVLASMISLSRGRAAGQSGWTNSLLKSMGLHEQRNEKVVPLVTRWFNLALAGEGGDATLWTLGRIALLAKPQGGERVVAIGETIVRLLCRTVAFAVKSIASVKLAPHQFSVGVAGGVEQVAQAFALLEKGVRDGAGSRGIVALDIRNAHPSIRRKAVADAVWSEMPELYPIFEWLYGGSSTLVLASGAIVGTVESGLRQGCPLAGIFFNLGIAAVLREASQAAPSTKILFFADDGNLEGDKESVKVAVMVLFEGFARIGLAVHDIKSVYYDGLPVGEEGAMELMGIRNNGEAVRFTRVAGAKIVGRVVGDEAFVKEAVARTVLKQARGLDKIALLQTDVALLLLTYCVNSKPTYLARNFPPSIIQTCLVEFDDKVDRCLATICQVIDPVLPYWVKDLRGLPVDLSGIGLTRLSEICEVAHVSCLVGALAGLQTRLPVAFVDAMREGISLEQMGLITHSLPFLVEDQRLRLPGEHSNRLPAGPVDPHVLYEQELAKVKQSSLARAMHKHNFASLRNRLQEDQQWARAAFLLSGSPQKQLSRWLRGGLFLNLHSRLAPNDFLECLRLRLMVPAFIGIDGRCGCTQRVPLSQEFHLLSCQAANREITYRHDRVRGALAAWCKKCVGPAGSVVEEVNLPRRGELSACRIDIIVTTALGEEYMLDVAVVNAMAKSYVHGNEATQLIPRKEGAAFVPGWAAEQKSLAKRSNALNFLSADQLPRFVPFSVEPMGRLGEAARGFVTLMEQCHSARIGDGAPALFRKLRAQLFLDLGMILARGAARILDAARAECRLHQHQGGGGGDEEEGYFDALDQPPPGGLVDELEEEPLLYPADAVERDLAGVLE